MRDRNKGRSAGSEPTIYDVAEAAGVSLATVSRVIQNRSHVRPGTREKVTVAMRELGYQPNLLASALMTKQSKTIGLLLPDISNPFFAEICRGVEDAANAAGFSVIICNTDENVEKERQQIGVLRQKGADGILFASAEMSGQNIRELQQSHYPVVLLVRGTAGQDVPFVSVDDFEGGYIAARHLIDLGHRRIALLAGPLRTTPALFRKKGYEAAMEQAGLSIDPLLVDSGPFNMQSGIDMARRMLQRGVAPPTAIVAGNDLIAIGAMKVLKPHGLRVPEDVSVVGFDRTALAGVIDPELTSVAQPTQALGTEAVQLLVQTIAHRNAPPRNVILPPMLVLGGSTIPILR